MKNKYNIGGATKAGESIKNKTGNYRTMKPKILHDKCKKCMKCAKFCPDSAIYFDKKTGEMKIDYNHCKGCGICAAECPFNAIVMEKEEK